jgi:hypothetical protein
MWDAQLQRQFLREFSHGHSFVKLWMYSILYQLVFALLATDINFMKALGKAMVVGIHHTQ